MKLLQTILLLTGTFAGSYLAADNNQNQDTSVGMEGERREGSLENREDRSQQRQGDRPDDRLARGDDDRGSGLDRREGRSGDEDDEDPAG